MYDSKLVFDVGMHQGEDTDYYLRLGYSVLGIEADPGLAEHCRIRFQDALATGRLKIVEGAIAPGTSGDRIKFFQSDNTVWGTTDTAWVQRNDVKGAHATVLEVRRIDMLDVYQAHGIPYYMKIDVEGVDLYVLRTLANCAARPKFISLESDKVDFNNLRTEIQVLQELGYTRFKAVQQDTIPGRNVLTRTIDGREYSHVFEPCSSGPFGDAIEQPWLTGVEILEEYSRIFEMYDLFGDNSDFIQLPPPEQQRIASEWMSATGYTGPLPGWYDTHAAL